MTRTQTLKDEEPLAGTEGDLRVQWRTRGTSGVDTEFKPTIIRHDRGAVSPVIATILLVAITVILAAVLYIMVSGLFNSRNTTLRLLGVDLSLTGNGANWTLTVSAVQGSPTQNDTGLTLISLSGATALSLKTLYQLETPTSGVLYIPAVAGHGTVGVGDRVVISVATYPSGTQYDFTSASSVVASGTLR